MPAPRPLDLRTRRVDDVPEGRLRPGRRDPELPSPARLDGRPVETAFLDRDGTLNRKAPEGRYVARPRDLVLLPGAGAAVARLNRAGVRTVLITNQRWLSRPGAVLDDYRATHARLIELLAEHGARLDAAYHCPHERGACDCRKPAPGMLRRAAADLRLDPARAVMIGDAESDMAAGRAAGTATMLLSAESMNVGPLRHRDADAVVPDLGSGVELLLASQRA